MFILCMFAILSLQCRCFQTRVSPWYSPCCFVSPRPSKNGKRMTNTESKTSMAHYKTKTCNKKCKKALDLSKPIILFRIQVEGCESKRRKEKDEGTEKKGVAVNINKLRSVWRSDGGGDVHIFPVPGSRCETPY